VPVSLQTLVLIALVVLATPRATRLLTRDKIPLIGVPRELFVQRWGIYEDSVGPERRTSIGGRRTNIVMSSLAYLWECDWCSSVWVASLLGYLTWRWPETMIWVLGVLIASYAAGWSSTAEACVGKKLKE
jgi:hypothetical protein